MGKTAGRGRVVIAGFPREESRLLVAAIHSEGFEADVVKEAERAVAHCLALSPEVLVCDIGMPEMRGLHVLDGLSRYARRPRVICIADGADEPLTASLSMAEFYGVETILRRPVDEPQFVRAFRRILA